MFKFNPITGKLDLSGDGASLYFEIVPVTITASNTWTSVPVTTITNVLDIEVYDQSNQEKVLIDSRIVSGGAEIRSKKLATFTVHIEGE